MVSCGSTAVNRCQPSLETEPLSKCNRIRRLSVALAVAGVLGVAAPAAATAATTITISGATASYPLVVAARAEVRETAPGQVKFKIAQGGAQVGINDVAAGRVTIGDVSRDPLASDPAGLVFYPIAKYGDLRDHEQVQHAHATSRRRS